MFKVGQKVKQINVNHSISKISWIGIIEFIHNNFAQVRFYQHPTRALVVSIQNLKRSGPINKPDMGKENV